MPEFKLSKTSVFLVCLALLWGVAVLSRWLLHGWFPILLTADSWDYIAISDDIYGRADFFHHALGDWRLPLYPLFLTLLRLLAPFNANNIVLAQKALGIASVILAGLVGREIASRAATIALMLFIALNPIYLFFEHLVMTEALFLCTLLAFTWFACRCLLKGLNGRRGFLLGITLALCLLTRANGLFFCLPFLAVILLRHIHTYIHALFPFVAALILGFLLFFAPWLWRNQQAYGKVVPFTANSNLNMLAYLAEHELLDVSRPSMQPYSEWYDPTHPRTVYSLLWKLRTTQGIAQAEQTAAALVREQLQTQPQLYGQQVWLSFLHFNGYPLSGPLPGRADVQNWFASILTNVESVHNLNKNFYTDQDTAYINAHSDNPTLALWANMGTFYFHLVRPILFLLFVFLFIFYVLLRKRSPEKAAQMAYSPPILALTIAYTVIILVHSITLADYDRFATPFDWVPFLVICLVISELWAQSKQGGVIRENLD